MYLGRHGGWFDRLGRADLLRLVGRGVSGWTRDVIVPGWLLTRRDKRNSHLIDHRTCDKVKLKYVWHDTVTCQGRRWAHQKTRERWTIAHCLLSSWRWARPASTYPEIQETNGTQLVCTMILKTLQRPFTITVYLMCITEQLVNSTHNRTGVSALCANWLSWSYCLNGSRKSESLHGEDNSWHHIIHGSNPPTQGWIWIKSESLHWEDGNIFAEKSVENICDRKILVKILD